jgi:hypothetical protein
LGVLIGYWLIEVAKPAARPVETTAGGHRSAAEDFGQLSAIEALPLDE